MGEGHGTPGRKGERPPGGLLRRDANLPRAGQAGMLASRLVIAGASLALGAALLGDALDPATAYPATFVAAGPVGQAHLEALDRAVREAKVARKEEDADAAARRKAVSESLRRDASAEGAR